MVDQLVSESSQLIRSAREARRRAEGGREKGKAPGTRGDDGQMVTVRVVTDMIGFQILSESAFL